MLEIAAAERELQAKKKALRITDKGPTTTTAVILLQMDHQYI
jgi:hypothetical protein